MNNIQLPFLVEGILILAAAGFGLLLRRKGKPYGKGKLVVHLFFFLWFATGFGFILYALSAAQISVVAWGVVTLMGLAVVTQLVSGLVLLFVKSTAKSLPRIHLTSAIVMFVCDVAAFFLTGS